MSALDYRSLFVPLLALMMLDPHPIFSSEALASALLCRRVASLFLASALAGGFPPSGAVARVGQAAVPYAGEGQRGQNKPRGEQLWLVQPFGRRRDVPRLEPHTVRNDWNRDPRHLHAVQVVESVPDDEADSERRQGKDL